MMLTFLFTFLFITTMKLNVFGTAIANNCQHLIFFTTIMWQLEAIVLHCHPSLHLAQRANLIHVIFIDIIHICKINYCNNSIIQLFINCICTTYVSSVIYLSSEIELMFDRDLQENCSWGFAERFSVSSWEVVFLTILAQFIERVLE